MLNGLNLNFDFVTQRIGLVRRQGQLHLHIQHFALCQGEFYRNLLHTYLNHMIHAKRSIIWVVAFVKFLILLN